MRNSYWKIWAWGWIIVTAVCLSGYSSAQGSNQPGGSQNQPTTPEQRCELDYHINAVTLGTNNHEMYWKMPHCIRIDVKNNPFIYVYKLEFDEETIAEDDVLGSLGSLFGLTSISQTPSAEKKAGGAGKAAAFVGHFIAPKAGKAVAPKACNAQQTDELASLGRRIQQLNAKLTDVEQSERSLLTPRNHSDDLGVRLDAKEAEYRSFQTEYLSKRAILTDNGTDVDSIRGRALELQAESLSVANDLTADVGFESDLVSFLASARLLYGTLDQLSAEESALEVDLDGAPACQAQKGGATDLSAMKGQIKETSDRIARDISELEAKTSQVAFTACKYKARKEGEFAWVYQHVYQPVTAVIDKKDAFYAWASRQGPKEIPTAVTVTLKRDPIVDPSANAIPAADNSVFECSNDPSTIFQSNTSFSTVDDLPVPKAKPQSSTASKGSGKQATDTSKTPTDKTQEATTVVLEQPWSFGKARFVLSGGLTTGFLGKREFQRSTSISGTTSPTVIGLKTDTRYRLTPMLYGHTLLYSKRHDSDGWYATLGVTANSDSKGTSPEFLLGASRSFAQQKFFLTLGSYIGEQQKLDGGLQVGQTIPSTLTGDLPVTKSYHASWGFGISYRFTSTKDPQKDSSTPTKPSKSGTKKSGS